MSRLKERTKSLLKQSLGEDRTRLAGSAYRDLSGRARYRLAPALARRRRELAALRDTHVGETCVIVGNGPSLKHTRLDALKGTHVFSLNRLYLMFDELDFTPSYHVVVNRHVVTQCADELRTVGIPLFTTLHNFAELREAPDLYVFPSLGGPRWSATPLNGLWEGGTVTYAAMQLAYFMGFKKVILIGVDHSFTTKGPANALVESAGDDPNHFSPAYFGKGFKWQLPDLDSSEIAYALARAHFQQNGREIVDCTVGGKLDVFRKSDLLVELG